MKRCSLFNRFFKLCFLTIIQVIKFSMRWGGGEGRGEYRVLGGKTGAKSSLGRHRFRW